MFYDLYLFIHLPCLFVCLFGGGVSIGLLTVIFNMNFNLFGVYSKFRFQRKSKQD